MILIKQGIGAFRHHFHQEMNLLLKLVETYKRIVINLHFRHIFLKIKSV